MNRQRGQTLPVWLFGILTTLMLMIMVFNYANALRWQIRGQNAADAVASGIMSVQTEHYNEILAQLHASSIEETRIRRTLASLLYVMHGSGGCETGATPTPTGSGDGRDCATVYTNLRANFIAEVTRYGQDVNTMSALSQYTQTQQIADMTTIANSFENSCSGTGATAGDCVFKYTVASPTERPNISGALADAAGEDNGNGRALPSGGNIAPDLQPLQIEVVACAKISSPFKTFFNLNVQPFYAIGRSAATSAMVTQEWSNPGVDTNPNSASGSAELQPTEFPENATNTSPVCTTTCYSSTGLCTANSSAYDWYAVRWCSNAYTSIFNNPGTHGDPVYGGYEMIVQKDEYSVWTGWWSVLPLAPYAGLFTPTSTNCAQNVGFNQ